MTDRFVLGLSGAMCVLELQLSSLIPNNRVLTNLVELIKKLEKCAAISFLESQNIDFIATAEARIGELLTEVELSCLTGNHCKYCDLLKMQLRAFFSGQHSNRNCSKQRRYEAIAPLLCHKSVAWEDISDYVSCNLPVEYWQDGKVCRIGGLCYGLAESWAKQCSGCEIQSTEEQVLLRQENQYSEYLNLSTVRHLYYSYRDRNKTRLIELSETCLEAKIQAKMNRLARDKIYAINLYQNNSTGHTCGVRMLTEGRYEFFDAKLGLFRIGGVDSLVKFIAQRLDVGAQYGEAVTGIHLFEFSVINRPEVSCINEVMRNRAVSTSFCAHEVNTRFQH